MHPMHRRVSMTMAYRFLPDLPAVAGGETFVASLIDLSPGDDVGFLFYAWIA
jgi:hypothetical protein